MDSYLAAALLSLALDFGQSRYIASHPETFHENNQILGLHPSVGRVNSYFGLAAAGIVGASFVLKGDTRKYFLVGVTVMETTVIINNHSLGIGVKF